MLSVYFNALETSINLSRFLFQPFNRTVVMRNLILAPTPFLLRRGNIMVYLYSQFAVIFIGTHQNKKLLWNNFITLTPHLLKIVCTVMQ